MNKLGIIGGSGLYNMEGLENSKWIKVNTPWGSPSDEILQAELKGKEIFFYHDMEEGTQLIHPTLILEQISMP